MVEDNEFIGYIGIPEIHDAKVTGVQHVDDKVSVILNSYEQKSFRIEFDGVQSITSIRPEGMMVYSLSEMRAPAPIRHFMFTNWDEEDDATLEIWAQGFTIVYRP